MAAHRGCPGGMSRRLMQVVVFVAGIGLVPMSASAITCKGEYQVVQGQLLATPYCQDNYLAKIAQQYGTRVSGREIRNNPNKKAEVCRFMGHDSRVSHICLPYRDDSPGFGR